MKHYHSTAQLVRLLGAKEATSVILSAKRADRLEQEWVRKFRDAIRTQTYELLQNAEDTGRLKFELIDFVPLLMRHAYEMRLEAIKSTKPGPQKLSAPSPKMPRSLKGLREWWDLWRKTKKPTRRQRVLGERLKRAYMKNLENAWKEHGETFRSGKTASNTDAVRALMEAADVTFQRAKMTVETESTHYYNQMRRDIFDESEDVTHYMFMAIRDAATTKWCKTRHGLVYAKGDPLLDKETPAIHWYCRSELIPLTPKNPTHRRIIEDASRRRRNHKCEPLPAGWTGRSLGR